MSALNLRLFLFGFIVLNYGLTSVGLSGSSSIPESIDYSLKLRLEYFVLGGFFYD